MWTYNKPLFKDFFSLIIIFKGPNASTIFISILSDPLFNGNFHESWIPSLLVASIVSFYGSMPDSKIFSLEDFEVSA